MQVCQRETLPPSGETWAENIEIDARSNGAREGETANNETGHSCWISVHSEGVEGVGGSQIGDSSSMALHVNFEAGACMC